MTAFQQIRHSISPELDRLHHCMEQALASPNPLMNRVVEGYLKSKGKLIRPTLVILTARLLGQVNDATISAAAAVEMLHNASLIHDDVIDESKLRRSRPTVNALWDNHIAVLVGDFFVSSALQMALSTDDIRIIRSIAELGRILSLGEIDQIDNARSHSINEQAYFNIISSKTASLFISCILMGAYSVGAPDHSIKPLTRFAELLGLCFQIKDDIFDYSTDPAVGKPTANDLREGKITLPLIHALSLTDHPRHEAMLELSRQPDLNDEQIHTLYDFAIDAGGIDYAYATMKRLSDEANAILDTLPHSPAVDDFRQILDYIITRNH